MEEATAQVQKVHQPPMTTERKFRLVTILLGAVHLVVGIALFLFFQPSPEPIVLRYNVYFGIDILSAWWQVYLIPLLSAVFVFVNVFLAERFLRMGQRLLALIFLLGSGIITLGLVIAIAAIVLINY
jgi:hypothetical protein